MLTGCQSPPKTNIGNQFQAQFESRSLGRKVLTTIEDCPFQLSEFIDGRQSTSLGSVSFSVIENDVRAWSLAALSRLNIKQDNNGSEQLKVTLVKAYIHSVYTSMNANVVFKVEKRNSLTQDYENTQYFRGFTVNTNWASGRGEILDAMNEAMTNAITKIHKAYEKHCH